MTLIQKNHTIMYIDYTAWLARIINLKFEEKHRLCISGSKTYNMKCISINVFNIHLYTLTSELKFLTNRQLVNVHYIR